MKLYDLIARGSSYQSGDETKTVWHQCGRMVETERGRTIYLDVLPTSTAWDGALIVKERSPKPAAS